MLCYTRSLRAGPRRQFMLPGGALWHAVHGVILYSALKPACLDRQARHLHLLLRPMTASGGAELLVIQQVCASSRCMISIHQQRGTQTRLNSGHDGH